MKLLLFLVFPFWSFSQDIPKNTNQIIITTLLPDNALYKRAGQLLLEEGFTIKNSNSEFLQIQTDARKVKGANSYPTLMVSVSDGEVKVTDYFGSAIGLNSNPLIMVTILTWGHQVYNCLPFYCSDLTSKLSDIMKMQTVVQTELL